MGIDKSDQQMCWSAEADLGASCFARRQPQAACSKIRGRKDEFIFALQSRITNVTFKNKFSYELENYVTMLIIKMAKWL